MQPKFMLSSIAVTGSSGAPASGYSKSKTLDADILNMEAQVNTLSVIRYQQDQHQESQITEGIEAENNNLLMVPSGYRKEQRELNAWLYEVGSKDLLDSARDFENSICSP